MSLKKWGEVKYERGYIGAIVGAIVLAIIGSLVYQVYGGLIGIVVGFLIGHAFDPVKTIIYREEEKTENK